MSHQFLKHNKVESKGNLTWPIDSNIQSYDAEEEISGEIFSEDWEIPKKRLSACKHKTKHKDVGKGNNVNRHSILKIMLKIMIKMRNQKDVKLKENTM